MPQYAVFTDGLHDDIVPGGWLKEILVRQDNGLSSHPEAMSYPFDSKLWVGELKRDTESRVQTGGDMSKLLIMWTD